MNGPQYAELLGAALRDDTEHLHELAAKLDTSSRRVLFVAAATMMNVLAAQDARLDVLRRYARQLSPDARNTLRAYAESVDEDSRPAAVPAVTANALRIGGLVSPDGMVTEDGREVLRLLEIDVALRVRDAALSDEDFDHDPGPSPRSQPAAPHERVRGMWPR